MSWAPTYPTLPSPIAGAGEVLVEVGAAGLHPIVKARASGARYSSGGQIPAIPGLGGVACWRIEARSIFRRDRSICRRRWRWKMPRGGKVQEQDFPTSLGNPARTALPFALGIGLEHLNIGDCMVDTEINRGRPGTALPRIPLSESPEPAHRRLPWACSELLNTVMR